MTQNTNYFADLLIPQLLLLSLIQSFIPNVSAQSALPPPDLYSSANITPTIITIIVIIVVALILMGFFSIYIRRHPTDAGGSIRRALSLRRARAIAARRGLDSSVIETFPTFPYSSVKGLMIGNGALECAVCLNEYEDEETLRLLPKCDHVFHPECIDAWFKNHVTCPVCRTNLLPEEQVSQQQTTGDLELGVPVGTSTEVNDNVSMVEQQEVEERDTQTVSMNRNQSVKANRTQILPKVFNKFRSHSTGHSLVQPGENLDRYTLRLPEDVRKQVVRLALLNRTGSTVRMDGEGSGRRGYRTGGALSGRRKTYKRLESLDRVVVKPERWVMSRAPSFLTRALSIKSPRVLSGNGEASTSATSPKVSKMTADEVPLNNVGPKNSDERWDNEGCMVFIRASGGVRGGGGGGGCEVDESGG
ncbi:E3 ubiquitin-protein ligase ATL31-like [Rutidosis leptorrhynchoides]|uniref:E3 ubiquitin-protein ligase ATL31-like n=1 Tax=Rutidosis leptorrhynchoides TaxID=125765 RepID=UPI003A996F58